MTAVDVPQSIKLKPSMTRHCLRMFLGLSLPKAHKHITGRNVKDRIIPISTDTGKIQHRSPKSAPATDVTQRRMYFILFFINRPVINSKSQSKQKFIRNIVSAYTTLNVFTPIHQYNNSRLRKKRSLYAARNIFLMA